jgi:hypothetical protein
MFCKRVYAPTWNSIRIARAPPERYARGALAPRDRAPRLVAGAVRWSAPPSYPNGPPAPCPARYLPRYAAGRGIPRRDGALRLIPTVPMELPSPSEKEGKACELTDPASVHADDLGADVLRLLQHERQRGPAACRIGCDAPRVSVWNAGAPWLWSRRPPDRDSTTIISITWQY